MTYIILPLFFGLRGGQLIFVIVLVLLLFGAARIPQIMRNLGKGVHSFKQGIEDAKAEMNKPINRASDNTPSSADTPADKAPMQSAQPKDIDR